MTDEPQSDLTDFKRAVADVSPLRNDRASLKRDGKPSPSQTHHYRRQAAEQESEAFVDGLSTTAVEIIESEQDLLFASSGIQVRQMKKLRRGHIPWQAGLDLHGYTLDQAREELSRFIRDCEARGLRCALIVHGKSYSQPGQPALMKSHVNDWLRQLAPVLAFCSAQPADGGAGAVYVLLKQKPAR
ncbi:DNA mismatch repair protein MutS [Marinobacterium zhoushanense]|uniref:DNA mismatch repair protein MutS n=1 Tax=Marinobacterium zhoushanense TaxID=1679163 RepID=A0ABQ1K8P4_9GAMM|nr:Smr/MutS family protein [Marinobacterium zhoushanense]GGB90315.1 DNA mismatch repair protein MutS [Marinobacterium zhoushanense]